MSSCATERPASSVMCDPREKNSRGAFQQNNPCKARAFPLAHGPGALGPVARPRAPFLGDLLSHLKSFVYTPGSPDNVAPPSRSWGGECKCVAVFSSRVGCFEASAVRTDEPPPEPPGIRARAARAAANTGPSGAFLAALAPHLSALRNYDKRQERLRALKRAGRVVVLGDYARLFPAPPLETRQRRRG